MNYEEGIILKDVTMAYLQVLSQNLPAETLENHKKSAAPWLRLELNT
jgi:hypothetical protein